MELLELYLSPLDDSTKFEVIVTDSPAGQGRSESFLPFLAAEWNWRITVIRSLEVSSFRPEFFSAQEQEWMIQAGILGGDRSNFHPNYLINIGEALYSSMFPPGSKVENLLQKSISFAESKSTKLLVRQIFGLVQLSINFVEDWVIVIQTWLYIWVFLLKTAAVGKLVVNVKKF